MPRWRAFAAVAVVAAVFGLCFALLVDALGARSPWLGLALMFDFMGLAKVAEPIVRLRSPRALRAAARGPFVDGVDRRLGVRAFGALLRDTPLRSLNRSVYLARGTRDLAALRVQAESAEAIHVWAAILFTPWIAYVAARGLVAESVSFVLVQVAVNVYPILHLRQLRARLDRIARRARTRPGGGDVDDEAR